MDNSLHLKKESLTQYSKYKRDQTVNMNDCRLRWFLLKLHSETQKLRNLAFMCK